MLRSSSRGPQLLPHRSFTRRYFGYITQIGHIVAGSMEIRSGGQRESELARQTYLC